MTDMALVFDSSHRIFAAGEPSGRSLMRHFSRLEQTVIALGQSDSRGTLGKTWLGGLLERLFGLHPAGQMADPKLETLRRMSLLLRLRPDDLEPEEVERFLAYFTWDQLVALSDSSAALSR